MCNIVAVSVRPRAFKPASFLGCAFQPSREDSKRPSVYVSRSAAPCPMVFELVESAIHAHVVSTARQLASCGWHRGVSRTPFSSAPQTLMQRNSRPLALVDSARATVRGAPYTTSSLGAFISLVESAPTPIMTITTPCATKQGKRAHGR